MLVAAIYDIHANLRLWRLYSKTGMKRSSGVRRVKISFVLRGRLANQHLA